MIPVSEAPQPTPPDYDFHHDVFERGEDAIRRLAGLPALRVWPGSPIMARVTNIAEVTPAMLRDYPYWTLAMPALHKAYHGYCAYTARYIEWIEQPTTDHFVALRNATELMLAYTWSNYRLAHGYVSGRKSHIPDVRQLGGSPSHFGRWNSMSPFSPANSVVRAAFVQRINVDVCDDPPLDFRSSFA